MASIRVRIDRVKADPTRLVDRRVVERACIEAGHRWRDRVLDPATTLRVFAMQIANANTAISHTIRLAGGGFTESAYCQARSRLPVPVVRAVFDASVGATRREGRWCGRRVAIVDGSGVSVPDTPELRAFFGTAGGCAEGCGLPLMSVLAVFDADDGRLLDVHAAPGCTHDLRHASDLHPALAAGDVLVGDRGFCAYVHLAALRAIGCDGVFRVSKTREMPFPAKRGERTRHAYNRHRRHEPILVEMISEDDQVVEIVKPHNRPKHMTPEAFARVPSKMIVRAVRYAARGRGMRSRQFTLLTTLTDAKEYPAQALAELYLTRWRVEVNLRHLKRTMGMDRLKCHSVDGVMRELLMFALIYNEVCRCRSIAAANAGVDPTRVSFVDTLRAMQSTGPAAKIWPLRPPRTQPRLLKRAHSEFRIMTRPRADIIDWIEKHERVAN
jgi:hypothetical protein